jgi:hypothetical protein
MCFESILGWTLLAMALVSYVTYRVIENINWELHFFYFRLWLRRVL